MYKKQSYISMKKVRTTHLSRMAAVLLFAIGTGSECGLQAQGHPSSSPAPNVGEMTGKTAGATQDWKPITPMLAERFEHGCALVDGHFYVFGGYGQGVNTSQHVMVFDFAKGEWRRLHDMPGAITHFNPVVDGRAVWFAGGYKDSHPGYAIDEVWKYDVDKDAFVAGPSLPGPRAGGGLARVGRKLHYISGLMDRDNDSPDH